ncbi:conjugative transposon protein TraN [Chitinophaga sp. MM2321]|uniref:conjugative transposon protein TraN n=1 Tax=Chitinophaga sp. MM2321 TaxID=3137178 RepID=UPI0032D56973
MRKCGRVMMWVIMLFLAYTAKAQNLFTEVKAKVIPLNLEITRHKTTNLIFPYVIKSVDRGSAEVLVQKAQGVENILQVKAASDSLKETNLTVVCADGTLYSFILHYFENPAQLNFSLGKVVAQSPWALFADGENNEAKVNDLATQLTHKRKLIRHLKNTSNEISLSCLGIYIKDDVIYCQLELKNGSNINYTVDQLRFYVQDLNKAKRTASQQLRITPLYLAGNATAVGSRSAQNVVVAIPKFTIPDQKVFIIEMMEENGGRNLLIRLRNRHLIHANQI